MGYTHEKCDKCAHEKMWQQFNQLPDALRLPLQKSSIKINSDKCRMTKMSEFEEHITLKDGDKYAD